MSKYSTLKAEIIASIKRNGAQAITGDLLQEKLLAMIDSLGEHYQFGGLAIPSTEFTAGDEPVVFIAATPGTYTNFGGLVVADDEVALLVWSGSAWSKQTTDIATRSEVSQLGQVVSEIPIVSVSQHTTTGETTIGVGSVSVDVANADTTPIIEKSNADFAITDENKNAIVFFKDGEIKTKEFDSRDIKIKDAKITEIDYAISDSLDNLLVVFSGGHIKTKEFDSRDIGRHFGTFSIIGDSYSAFKGYSKPDTNSQWYPTDDSSCQGYNSGNDVTEIEESWFYLFANEYKSALIQNDSYSGSTICYDGYSPGHDSGAAENSFCKRIERLTGDCELLFIFGGTNDSWAGSSIGDYKYSGWTEEDKEYFRPALAYLIDYINKNHVGTQIVFILNNGLSSDINTSVETICEHYGVPLLKLSNITKIDGHPSIMGMAEINEQLQSFLKTIKYG